jgi:hypothetical protein
MEPTNQGETPQEVAKLNQVKFQKFAQCCRSSLVHSRTHGYLHGFQIQTAGLAPFAENELQEML